MKITARTESILAAFLLLAAPVAPGCKSDDPAAPADGGAGGAAVGTGGASAGGSAGADAGTGAGGAAGMDAGGLVKVTVALASLGTSMASGTATFERVLAAQIKLTIEVTNALPAGDHGIHIHANASCGDTTSDAGVTPGGAAGGHWNPAMATHATLTTSGHLGDIGNIRVDATGKGQLVIMTDKWTMGGGASSDILNHALVLHAGTDDFMTQPTGNSGGRIACGIIQ